MLASCTRGQTRKALNYIMFITLFSCLGILLIFTSILKSSSKIHLSVSISLILYTYTNACTGTHMGSLWVHNRPLKFWGSEMYMAVTQTKLNLRSFLQISLDIFKTHALSFHHSVWYLSVLFCYYTGSLSIFFSSLSYSYVFSPLFFNILSLFSLSPSDHAPQRNKKNNPQNPANNKCSIFLHDICLWFLLPNSSRLFTYSKDLSKEFQALHLIIFDNWGGAGCGV